MYFFRIFRSTGYYIRMIIEVLIDMASFTLILVVVIIAFGVAYMILGRNHSEGATLPDMK